MIIPSRTISLRCLILAALIMQIPLTSRAAADSPDRYDPVADPKAVVTVGHARFTVLTPNLIRMEWAADGQFEDHASLVFLNRKLPVPKFEQSSLQAGAGVGLTIKTSALTLTYSFNTGSDYKLAADNLSVMLHLNGTDVVWK